MASGRNWLRNDEFYNRNTMIRYRLEGGMTEEEFIGGFDEIMEFTGFSRFVPFDKETGSLARIERIGMAECLGRIHRMNASANKWADISSMSDKLRVFLKLRNEEI
jgi:hypothetical protein